MKYVQSTSLPSLLFIWGFYIQFYIQGTHYLYRIILQLHTASLRCLNKATCTSTIKHLLKSTQLVSLKLLAVIQYERSLITLWASTRGGFLTSTYLIHFHHAHVGLTRYTLLFNILYACDFPYLSYNYLHLLLSTGFESMLYPPLTTCDRQL